MSEGLIGIDRAAVYYAAPDNDMDRYRQMAVEYRQVCTKRPFVKRCDLAFMIGARQFSVNPNDLRRSERGGGRPTWLVETRQKLMAFARIVSEGESGPPNSWKGIGRTFNRHHASVIHAAHKYGAEIAAIIS